MDWVADTLLDGFEMRRLELQADYEGALEATLVRLSPRDTSRPCRAVLWVHGYADYFFHAHVARFFHERGIAFYALDLRKYGRSLRQGQTPNFCLSVSEYGEELDLAVGEIVRAGVSDLTIIAHSTGALVAQHWRQRRQGADLVSAFVYNSPFFALPSVSGHALSMERYIRLALRVGATIAPYAIIPRPGDRLYGRSLHAASGGEWEYDLSLKPHDSFPVRLGWLSAILSAQASVRHVADGASTLVITSAHSARSDIESPPNRVDCVLDVEVVRQRAATIFGSAADSWEVLGASHDVFLSERSVRDPLMDSLATWMGSTAG